MEALVDALSTLADLSDADAAMELSTPIKTAKSSTVTYTTLASLWGAMRAAQFIAMVRGGMAGANQEFAALCALADAILSGPGLSPADPQAQVAAAQFVGAKLASQTEVDGAFYDVSYRCGSPVTAEQVTTARAAMAVRDAMLAREQKIVAAYNAGMALNQGGETDLKTIQAAIDGALA